ncbi:MAG: hypothetical protein ABSH22_18330 [Tepidisphaeraceae bacterium]
MFQFLAYTPWWFIAAVALTGAVLLTYGNARANVRVRTAGLLTVSLAILLLALVFLVDTDAERMERRTVEIVNAADKQDWPKLATLLDDDTEVFTFGKSKDSSGRQGIADAAAAAAKMAGLKSVAIANKRTTQDDTKIAVTFTAGTVQDETGGSGYPSGWEFDYFPNGKQWDLREIRLLSVGSESVQ